MPKQIFLSDPREIQDTRRVVSDRSNETLIKGLTPLATEVHKSVQNKFLKSEIEDTQQAVANTQSIIEQKQDQLAQQTKALVDSGVDTSEALTQTSNSALSREIAAIKRGEAAGLITSSAGQARIKAKTREFANRFPGFANTFARTGEIGIQGFSTSSILTQATASEQAALKADAKLTEKMVVDGRDPNNPAERQWYQRLQGVKSLGALQAEVLKNRRYIGASDWQLDEQINFNSIYDQLLATSGIGGKEPIKDAKLVATNLSVQMDKAIQETRTRGLAKGFDSATVKQQTDAMEAHRETLIQSIEDGSADSNLKRVVENTRNLSELGFAVSSPDLYFMARNKILEPYNAILSEIAGMEQSQRDLFFDQFPDKERIFNAGAQQGVANAVKQYVTGAAAAQVNSLDSAMQAFASMHLQKRKPAVKDTPPPTEEIEAMRVKLDSNNNYDIKWAMDNSKADLIKANPVVFNRKLTNAQSYVQDELRRADLPEGARIITDPKSLAVAVVDAQGRTIGMSTNPDDPALRPAYNDFVKARNEASGGVDEIVSITGFATEDPSPNKLAPKVVNLLSYIKRAQRTNSDVVKNTDLTGLALDEFVLDPGFSLRGTPGDQVITGTIDRTPPIDNTVPAVEPATREELNKLLEGVTDPNEQFRILGENGALPDFLQGPFDRGESPDFSKMSTIITGAQQERKSPGSVK